MRASSRESEASHDDVAVRGNAGGVEQRRRERAFDARERDLQQGDLGVSDG
jgi:hypothetical protein